MAISIGLFLLAILWNFQGSYYEGKWLGFGLAFTAILAVGMAKRVGWIAAVTVSYLLSSALWVLLYADNPYAQVAPNDLLGLKYYAAEAALKLLLIVVPLLLIDVNDLNVRRYGRFLALFFVIISAGKSLFDLATIGCAETNSCGGLLMNPSLNAGMLVVALPIAVDMVPFPAALGLVALVSAAIVAGKSGVGLAAFSLFLGLYALKRWWALLLVPIAFIVRQFYGTEKILLSFGDRDVMWKFFMENWAHNRMHWWIGSGFGTFDLFSFNLQKHFYFRPQYWWKWMHNDLLELVFETGPIGGVLLIAVFVVAIKGLYGKGFIAEAKALLLFGASALVNYPLHIGLTCAFAVWLAYLGLNKEHGCRATI